MEKNFIVYFEIFDKKMKTSVIAKTQEEAKSKVFEKITFHKIEEDLIITKEVEDMLGMFGIKRKNK